MGAICSQALVTFATMASQRPANSVWNSWNLLTSGVMTLAITQSARGWTAAFTASHTPIQKLRNSSEVFQRYRNAATSAPMSVMTMPMGFSFMVPLSSLVALSTRVVAAARAFSATVTASEYPSYARSAPPAAASTGTMLCTVLASCESGEAVSPTTLPNSSNSWVPVVSHAMKPSMPGTTVPVMNCTALRRGSCRPS